MLTFTFFFLAAFGLLTSRKILGDFFSPLAVYTFFWAFSLGALHLEWVSFDPLGRDVWLAIGISYFAFMMGGLIPTFYALTRNTWQDSPFLIETVSRVKMERTLAALFGLGILGFVVQLAHMHAEVGLTTFLTDPIRMRDVHSHVKFLGFLDILNLANFVLGILYVRLFPSPKRWVYLMLLWALLTTLVSTDRTRFFYTVIWCFFAVVYAQRQIRITPRLIMSGILTLGALLAFFLLVAKVYKKQAYDDNMEYINIPQDYAALIDPYIYLTGSYPVLQAVLADPADRTHGKYTFEPLVKLIEVIYPDLSRAEIVGKFYRVPVELNVATYVQPFFQDWGWTGVLLCPFVLGLITMWAYFHMRQRKTIFAIYFTALLGFCVTISVFVNHFTQTATCFFIVVGYLVGRVTRATPESPGGSAPPAGSSE